MPDTYHSPTHAAESRRAQASPGGSATIQTYDIADATVIQNSVGATFSGNEITMPGGSSAADPSSANALILEWDALDPAGTALATLVNGDALIGMLATSEVTAATHSTDLVLWWYLRLDDSGGSGVAVDLGLRVDYAGATDLRVQAFYAVNGSVTTGSGPNSLSGVRDFLCDWLSRYPKAGGGPMAMATLGATPHTSATGSASSSGYRSYVNNPTIGQVGAPSLRLAVTRTSGSAGDLTTEHTLSSVLMLLPEP